MEEYIREFQQIEEELGSEMREKDPTALAKTWKSLSQRFTKRVYTSAVRFDHADGILEFALEPVHYYDEVTREFEAAEQLRKERQENYKRARTIRTC